MLYSILVSSSDSEDQNNNDSQERKLCHYANKGTCRFQDDQCRYRHVRCQSYDSCSLNNCRLAHGPSKAKTHTDSNQRFNSRRTSNHPPATQKPCRDGDQCKRKDCRFFHTKEQRPTYVQDTIQSKVKPEKVTRNQRNPKDTPSEVASNLARHPSLATVPLSAAKCDFLARFGKKILEESRKRPDVQDIKVENRKLRLSGDDSAIHDIQSHLEQVLYERNVTIIANLERYLKLSQERLLQKFLTKYRVGIDFSRVASNASTTVKNPVANRNRAGNSGETEREEQNNNDRDMEQSEDDDDDQSDTSSVASYATRTPGQLTHRPYRPPTLIQVTLCSDSDDSLSKAREELQSYKMWTHSWILRQDEREYIFKQPRNDNQPPKGKQPPKGGYPKKNSKFHEQYLDIRNYLANVIKFNPNSVVLIKVIGAKSGVRVVVKGFKSHVDNAVSKMKSTLDESVQAEIQLPISVVMEVFLRRKAGSDLKQLEKTNRIKISIPPPRRKHENDDQDDATQCLKLIGSNSCINSAKTKVEDFLESLCEKKQLLPCNSWDIARNIRHNIIEHFKKSSDSDDCNTVGWTESTTAIERRNTSANVTISIVGFNEEAVEDAIEQCTNIVEGYDIWKPSSEVYDTIHRAIIVKKSPPIEELRQQWETNIQLDRATNTITIPARSKVIADEIKEALLSLGQEKRPQMSRISEMIPVPSEIRRFVNRAASSLLDEAKSRKIFVEFKNRHGLTLNGRPDLVSEFKQKINAIIDDIKQKIVKHRLSLSSAESDLLRSDAYKITKSIERETNTLIHDVSSSIDTSASSTTDDHSNSIIASISNSRGQTIIVRKGDITKIKDVDAIINAANGQLYHAGGVDKLIANAAGPAYDRACQQLIAQNDGLPIAIGKAVKTTAGDLPFKCIIHAIGPQFVDGNHHERPLLFFSVLSSIRLAEENGYESVALPAISSHTYKFPLADCTNILVRAMKQFFADYPQSTIRKIILIDIDETVCDSFAREIVLDHRDSLADDDEIINRDSSQSSLPAKWCWMDHDSEKIYDENHTREIESAFQNYLKTSDTAELFIFVDNLSSGILTDYTIHFHPNLQQMLVRNPDALNKGLVCGYQLREMTNNKRDIIRYPVIQKPPSIPVAYSPKPLDLFSLQKNITNYDWDITAISRTAIKQVQVAIQKAIDSATISEQYSIDLDRDIDTHKDQIKSIGIEQKIQIDFPQASSGPLLMILKGFKANVQEAKLKITLYAHGILRSQVDNENESDIPKEWGDQTDNLQLVKITRSDPNFARIENRMKETLPNAKVHQIERVQNLRMWSHYVFRRQQLQKELSLKPNLQIEQELFHGTRSTPPNEIYNGEYGFDMTYSTSGLWGIGTYFAQNAAYSCSSYAFKLPNGQRQVFLAHVLTGEAYDCPSDESLRRPPKKNEGSSGLRYNSISGVTGGTKVYIVYENRVAYPTYLITFTL